MASPIPASAVSENLRKHIDPKAPAPLRLMAARGMVPMGPRDMVTVLTALSYDEDDKIESAAIDSLVGLPERILKGALSEALHPLVLDHLARTLPENEEIFEAILINQATPDETFEYLADQVSSRLLGIILENQVRMLRHTSIVTKCLENPDISKAQVDRMMDFAVRTGMQFEDLDAFEEARARIKGVPLAKEEQERLQEVILESLPDDLLMESDEDYDEDDEAAERRRVTLLQRLSRMTIAQKVALAQKGNKTVRSQLIKERNKVVCTAAISNPGVNEAEAAVIASNRAVSEDVIRIIANKREWTRSYQVKVALVQNPKTPMALAMRFLNNLRNPDLKNVATSKSISSSLAGAAKKILRKRQGLD
ncbi:MAG: hypothetical protein JXR96_00195 [Deltaproteobacteria bacterium]|nr:hypothetical protein [Deltaproteobacteria bacterium]